MAFTFKNIDSDYIKVSREFVGDIQPKFWFRNTQNHRDKMLVKRQHSQNVNGQKSKSKMFNHFGEYYGYLLMKKAGLNVCPVDLISLHDTKNKYSKTPCLYTACGSHKVSNENESLLFGEVIAEKYISGHPEILDKVSYENSKKPRKGSISVNEHTDNIDIIVEAILAETSFYERKMKKKTNAEIRADAKNNVKSIIEMAVFDCALGNNDRHSQNWALKYNNEEGTVSLYPAYDNERVLGLSKPEFEVKKQVENETYKSEQNKEIFSRMGFGQVNSGVYYEDMLEHLAEKYPKYSIPAMQNLLKNIDEEFVKNLFDESFDICERSQDSVELSEDNELPVEYKTYGMHLYNIRKEFIRELVKKKELERNWKFDKSKDVDLNRDFTRM